MSWKRILMVVVVTMLLATVSASAQSVLRIGLNDDPDALDPTISRAYVGRLVFAALCDKLFDVTPDLKIVPQLAEAWEWAPDGKSLFAFGGGMFRTWDVASGKEIQQQLEMFAIVSDRVSQAIRAGSAGRRALARARLRRSSTRSPARRSSPRST